MPGRGKGTPTQHALARKCEALDRADKCGEMNPKAKGEEIVMVGVFYESTKVDQL